MKTQIILFFISATLCSCLASECGYQAIQPNITYPPTDPNSLITYGSIARPFSWPWQVNVDENCGGTLIDRNWVLTAAHCVHPPGGIDLRFGLFKGFDSDPEKGEVDYKKQATFRHPKYNRTLYGYYDIALVKLDKPIKYTKHISPVCLPVADNKTKPSIDKPVVIIGWGRRRNDTKSQKLRQAVVHVHPIEKCQISEPWAHNDVICVGEKRKDGCHGDSGGPMLLKNAKHGPWVQVGVASYVTDPILCENGYSAYTAVSYYCDWIKEVTGKEICVEKM